MIRLSIFILVLVFINNCAFFIKDSVNPYTWKSNTPQEKGQEYFQDNIKETYYFFLFGIFPMDKKISFYEACKGGGELVGVGVTYNSLNHFIFLITGFMVYPVDVTVLCEFKRKK